MIFLTGLLVTCGNQPAPTIARDISINPNIIEAGKTANLSIEASGENLKFEWTAINGKIVKQAGPAASYAAPDSPGSDTVTVTITGGGGTITKELKIQIVPAAGQAPTAAPTSALTPAAPAATSIPAAPAATSIPAAPAATSIPAAPSPEPQSPFKPNVKDGDEVAQTITLMGEYPPGFAGDLWVFIVPPSDLYYPQSPNACAGRGTPNANGKWEVRVGFGGPDDAGIPFQIVIAEANARASQVIANMLRQWCQANKYPGIDKDKLPAGMTLKETIKVTRNADHWGSAPEISNTQLPGQVTIANVAEGDKIPRSKVIMGTYTNDAAADIWVLLYASNGRWYPQSTNACRGVHAQTADGKWQVLAGFGGPSGDPFDIAVVLANADASAFFASKQQEWCKKSDYLGFFTIELPQGIEVKSQVRVTRQ